MGVADPIQATALVAAACRAEETRQAAPRLSDPLAELFTADLDGPGRALLAAGREEVVHRTLLIDSLLLAEVRATPALTVVNLGAGLCTRPYRLDLATCREVIEVDAEPILARKTAALRGHEPTCPVRRIPADIRSLPDLAAAAPVLVIAEGLLVYLAPAELSALAGAVAGLPGAMGWIADIVSAESAQAMAAVAIRAQAGLTLSGLSSLDAVEQARWTVADYRILPVTRTPRSPVAPGQASARVVDGVLLLRPPH